MTTYLLGVVTPFAVALVLAVIREGIRWFTSTDSAHGCSTCDRWWGPQHDGSRSWVAGIRADWHMDISHPGHRGRALIRSWRGIDVTQWRRLDRMFPNPSVTVWDVIARLPLVSQIAFSIAAHHGRTSR